MTNNSNCKSSLDSLKKEAIRIYSGMIVVYPRSSSTSIYDVSEMVSKFNGCYATNNSTTCFISDNEVYATPSTRTVLKTLEASGLKKDTFYVPFSNDDYPQNDSDRWFSLIRKAESERSNEFEADCLAYCDEHHIGSLHGETIRDCLEIPTNGIFAENSFYETTVYPIINNNVFDSYAESVIGHFNVNNRVVVFIYRNGKTYLTVGSKIIYELEAAGYQRYRKLFVPLSNNEVIKDPKIKLRWRSIIYSR